MNDNMTAAKHQVTIKREPTGEVYGQLLDYARRFCDKALLVVRPDLPLGELASSLLLQLCPFIEESRSDNKWPGTELLEGAATIHITRYCEESSALLKGQVDGLFGWMQPNAPEDLCLIRRDGTPWLVTIAHEHDAYLEITPVEKQGLLRAVPTFEPFIKEA